MRVVVPVLTAAAFILLALSSCLEEECITVVVTNNTPEAIVVFETECWPLDVTVEPGKAGNIIVLPGEIIRAEGESSGTPYTHIFTNEYETWEIN